MCNPRFDAWRAEVAALVTVQDWEERLEGGDSERWFMQRFNREYPADLTARIIDNILTGEAHRICAWCGKFMGWAETTTGEPTHGICPECFEKQLAESEEEEECRQP